MKESETPAIGSRWQHANGIYTVYDITNEYSENPRYPITISYQGRNGKKWSRPLNDWHRSMKELKDE